MSFTLPDLVVEGAIRKGFDFLRLNAGKASTGPNVEENKLIDISNVPANELYSPIPTDKSNPLQVSLLLDGFQPVAGTPGRFSRVSDGQRIEFEIGDRIKVSAHDAGSGTFSINSTILTVGESRIVTTTSCAFTVSFVVTFNNQDGFIDSLNDPNDLASLEMAGTFINEEIIGPGDEVLNMLFDFEVASNSKDGGIPSSVSGKYTQEPVRLREFFRNNEIAIVQSFSDVQANLPCISIQLANDGEDQGLALTDDFGGIEAFDSNNGIGRDESTIHANTTINVGIHTKEQLLTKYLYHITKYFILSAKEDLIRQNFIIATFKGSDFTRDASWQGDHVYTRFLNVSGKTEDSWVNLDEIVVALENVGVNIFVPTVGTPASIGPGANQTPAQDVGGDNFVNASSVFSSVTTATAFLQLPSSLYHTGNGTAVFVQRNGFGDRLFTSQPFNFMNDKDTGILAASGISFVDPGGVTRMYEVISGSLNPDGSPDFATDRVLEVFEPATGTVSPVSTIQTPPSGGLVMAQAKQNINDANGVIHRSDVNQSDLI